MENAAKALLMAGGILIAMLVIGALVMMFIQLGDYQMSTAASEKQAQVAKFNNQFEPFNKEELSLMELKSVYNKIVSNNKRNPEYIIKSNIIEEYEDEKNIYTKYTSPTAEWTRYNAKDSMNTSQENVKMNSKFACTEIKYKNQDGRISEMNFKIVKDGY